MIAEALKPMSCCPHVIMVIGKGGVGKTTMSIFIAREMSKRGRTLLLSLDPARHLSKYLERGAPGMDVGQVSVEKEIEEIVLRHSDLLKALMPSLPVFNLDDLVDVVRYSPGAEEEVFLRKLLWAYRSKYEYVVVDTPPTGVTLRTLALSRLYVAWLNRLIEIRERIVALRYTIARTMGRQAEMKDKALERLYELREDYGWLTSRLSSPDSTSYVLVAMPEPLPIYEMEETAKFLKERMGVRPKLLVLNRVLPEDVAKRLGVLEAQKKYEEQLKGYGVSYALVEHLGKPTEGLEDVEQLASKIRVVVK
ncbi:MAG: ArsA family ATPase [Acidilobaceae archaeon]|nr:ArsA family ATPase [Acidilobaceae archaeon]